MRLATILAIAVLASPAAAEFDAFVVENLPPDYIMPTMRDGWGMPQPAPRIGVEGGQENREFKLALGAGGSFGDNDDSDGRGPGGGNDGYGSDSGVALDPFGSALQGMKQHPNPSGRGLAGSGRNGGGSTHSPSSNGGRATGPGGTIGGPV